jgi:glycerophosphoryl diester phosphodiesterase
MYFRSRQRFFIVLGVIAVVSHCLPDASAQPAVRAPRIIGHRGLMRHAPENTLAGFAACIHLRLGFELDIRRSKDGVLVCMHDDDIKRTTDGTGKVADFTLAELRKLDAGRWFNADFQNERVPTLEEVFILLKMLGANVLVALDIKIEDEMLEGDIVRLAKKHEVLGQVICIGIAISDPKMRARLRAADGKTPVAVLANKREDFEKALAAKDGDWIYVRFVPTEEEVKKIHNQKKRVILVGPLVAGNEPLNWSKARDAGVDAILTDYPLECQELWRAPKAR